MAGTTPVPTGTHRRLASFEQELDDHSRRRAGDEFRVVQMTPPGSACSISVGTGITDAGLGSVRGLHLVVNDIEAARAQLVERGVEVGDAFHFASARRMPDPDPQRQDYGSFMSFSDPDGNSWVVQEVSRSRSGA